MRTLFRVHAVERMFERGIGMQDLREALKSGENIETYSDSAAYPGRLILSWRGKRPLHVVIAENTSEDEIIIITSYRPNQMRWTGDFKRRRDEMSDV